MSTGWLCERGRPGLQLSYRQWSHGAPEVAPLEDINLIQGTRPGGTEGRGEGGASGSGLQQLR